MFDHLRSLYRCPLAGMYCPWSHGRAGQVSHLTSPICYGPPVFLCCFMAEDLCWWPENCTINQWMVNRQTVHARKFRCVAPWLPERCCCLRDWLFCPDLSKGNCERELLGLWHNCPSPLDCNPYQMTLTVSKTGAAWVIPWTASPALLKTKKNRVWTTRTTLKVWWPAGSRKSAGLSETFSFFLKMLFAEKSVHAQPDQYLKTSNSKFPMCPLLPSHCKHLSLDFEAKN